MGDPYQFHIKAGSMQRVLTRLFFSTRTSKYQKLLTTIFLVLMLSLIMCHLFGEMIAFTVCSRSWKWSAPYERESVSMYYQDGGSHYYVLRSHHQQLPSAGGGAMHKQTDKNAILKIMFISDPHIMCTDNSEEWWLARWDADAYLKRSFSQLQSHLKPDRLIFLGDIFSSGFQATNEQWEDYLQCFRDIYPGFTSSERVIVAMGDNDIGGEGRDLMTQIVYRRYVEAFGELNNIFDITENVRIIKVTTTCFLRPPSTRAEMECQKNLVHFLDTYTRKKELKSTNFEPPLTILISHVPLNELSKSAHFTYNNKAVDIRTKILLTLVPDVVVSGHVHHEVYTHHRLDKMEVHEITVPTCSYRMGELSMGVGTAVISASGYMTYKVNWLPPRYPFLLGYGVIGLTLLFVCVCLFLRFRKHHI